MVDNDGFFKDANVAGEIKGDLNNLVVRSAKLYFVRCLSDCFWVAAQNKDQVRKLLFLRGGSQNLESYTIKRHYFSNVEMIYCEVSGYDKVLSQSKFVEDNDIADFNLDCDE